MPFLKETPAEQMLRISRTQENGSGITLKLEGKISAEWAGLLQQECEVLIDQGKRVVLDFSGISYLDDQGVKIVRHLRAGKIRILNSSAFIDELLNGGGQT